MDSVHSLLLSPFQKYPQVLKPHLRVLLAHLMHQSPEFLMAHPEANVSLKVQEIFLTQAEALAGGMPLSRLLGKREFWGMDFELSSETLYPRPDSETLIEATLKQFPDRGRPLKILDLGTGTGCLIISLLTEYKKATGTAVDQSRNVLETAKKNSQNHGVADRLRLHQGDWFQGITDSFDIIISNPPYIAQADYEILEKNVKEFDPKKALTAGEEGLDCYKIIIPRAPDFLNLGGALVLEILHNQPFPL